jgi:hypothetical protein
MPLPKAGTFFKFGFKPIWAGFFMESALDILPPVGAAGGAEGALVIEV